VFELMKTRVAGSWGPAEIQRALELKHYPEVHRALRELRELGLVERIGFAEHRVVGGVELPAPRPRKSVRAWPASERIARGWSQAALAERAGLDRAYVSIIEQGRRQPSPKVRASLERALAGPSIH
jgi:hypothetical protein